MNETLTIYQKEDTREEYQYLSPPSSFSDEEIIQYLCDFETLASSSNGSGEDINQDFPSLEFEKVAQRYNKRKKKCGRKPTFRPQYIPELRILRNDIRRRYLEMYINVMNSHDAELTKGFFYEFCSPTLIYKRAYGDCAFSRFLKAIAPDPIAGVNMYLAALTTIAPLFADSAIKTENAKLFVTKGVSGSCIVATNIARGSVLYTVSRSDYDIKTEKESSLPSPEFSIVDPLKNELISIKLLPKPIPLVVRSLLTLKLDSNNRIEGIYYDTLSSSSLQSN